MLKSGLFQSGVALLFCARSFVFGIYVNNLGDPYDQTDSEKVSSTQGFFINNYTPNSYTEKYIYPYGNPDNNNGAANVSSFQQNPSFSNTVGDEQEKTTNNRLGFYNVQTGDEFFLNDFEVRPKFKTKKRDKHVLGDEYHSNGSIKRKGQVKPQQGTTTNKNRPNYPGLGPNKNRRPPTNSNKNNRNKIKKTPNTTRRRKPALHQIRKPTTTRRPILNNRNKITNNIKRKKSQQKKRKVILQNQHASTGCRNQNFPNNNRRPVRNGFATNKIKNGVAQRRKPNRKLNKLHGNRKRYKNRITRRNDHNSKVKNEQSKDEDGISKVIKKYMEKLKQNMDLGSVASATKKIGLNRPKQRSLFSMTLNKIRNQSLQFANRFMSLFNVVQHGNYRCSADNAFNYYEGTCYTEKQCLKLGGVAVGDCSNFERCCIFKSTCGGSSNQNCTYFESPDYPEYFPKDDIGTDQDEIEDYLDEGVSSTDSNQNQSEDYDSIENPSEEAAFTTPSHLEEITEASNSGFSDEIDDLDQEATEDYPQQGEIFDEDNLSDQNFNDKYKEYAISREANMAENFACTFKVLKTSERVQQMRIDFVDLELIGPDERGDCVDEKLMITGQNLSVPIPILCGYNTGQHVYVDVSKLAGPLQISILSNDVYSKRYKIRVCQLESPCVNAMNCLQHHVGIEGIISSFNYDQASMMARSNSQYLNNLNYAICIRRESGYCSITFSNINSEDEYLFDVRNTNDMESDEDANLEFGLGPLDCPDDFVVIDNMRICGHNFRTVTDTTSGPIVTIPIHTNEELTGVGFKLFYKQNKCTN